MRNLLRLEEFALFLLAVYLFTELGYTWWVFLVLFLAPDLSALGYLAGPRIGATTYNNAHHKGIAIAAYLVGVLLGSQILLLIGVIMLAHSSLDRVVGYGLKYPDSFDHTHLGWTGKTAKARAGEGSL
ncbi:MAG: DUF4260 domain-containing protein [Anaerolineales bacterium]